MTNSNIENTMTLRDEWMKKYLSKIAEDMIEANNHVGTLGELMLMKEFSQVVEDHLIHEKEGDENEAL